MLICKMKKTEIILWSLLLLFLVLTLNDKFFYFLSGLILFMLSTFYFCGTFLLLNDIPLKRSFSKSSYKDIKQVKLAMTILIGLMYSLTCISIMFKILAFPGSSVIVFLSLFFLVLTFIISICYSKNFRLNKNSTSGKIRIRNIIFIVIVILIVILRKTDLLFSPLLMK